MHCFRLAPLGLVFFVCLGLSFCTTKERRVFFQLPKGSHYLEECILTEQSRDTLLYFHYSFDSLTYKFRKQSGFPLGLQFTIHSSESYNLTYCGTSGLQLSDSLLTNVEATRTHLQNFRGNIADKMLSSGFAVIRDTGHGVNFLYIPGYIQDAGRLEHFKDIFSRELNAATKNNERVIIKTVVVDESKVYAQEELLEL